MDYLGYKAYNTLLPWYSLGFKLIRYLHHLHPLLPPFIFMIIILFRYFTDNQGIECEGGYGYGFLS